MFFVETFKPTRSLLENYGESIQEVLSRQAKVEEVSPELTPVAAEATRVREKSKKMPRKRDRVSKK